MTDSQTRFDVSIIMGSTSDLPLMGEATKVLDQFSVSYDVQVLSAHRSPNKLRQYLATLSERGVRVVIAGAGMSAHLAGVVAAEVVIPVIAVPLPGSPLQGFDSLFSMVQMPGGVPVATMGVGKSGARNAAILAAQILGLSDAALHQRLRDFKAAEEARYEIQS
ncbi:MAG: 5-(carboxyamino)imidazole ribonucleotide mutase [Myxococcales bacterium]|nr:5-(carboxyamino)imidazole ribonucleotide mutase [Myxococcales bacterium]